MLGIRSLKRVFSSAIFNVTLDLVPQVCCSDCEKLAPDVQSATSDATVSGSVVVRVALTASPAMVNHSAGSTWSLPVRTL